MFSQYFVAKKKIHPQQVKGKIRSLKNKLNFVFLLIYCLTPLLRFDRGQNSPNQAVLIDFKTDVIYFFAIEIWPQEIYYLAAILILAAVLLFFITSLFGRVWCGYACFQTVWTDIFIAIERFWQGDRNDRILLDRHRTAKYYYKKTATHLCWIVLSLLTGLIFVSYFNDILQLYRDLISFNLSIVVLSWIFGIGFATYLMAGFAREHVCAYMCPYARFQSAMFDQNTLVVAYQKDRGEPRQKWHQGDDFSKRGHCIDCKQCVVVCPVGIDIRNGLQMECIACGLCIDACDNIMKKVGLPTGLIKYNNSEATGAKIWRPRTFYYLAIIIAVCCFTLFALLTKQPISISVKQERNPLYIMLSDGSIRNVYELSITNRQHQDLHFTLSALNNKVKLDILNHASGDIILKQGSVNNFKIFLTANEPMQDIILQLSNQQNSYNIPLLFFSK